MKAPNPLLTAVILSITITGPAAMAAIGSGSAGVQAKKGHPQNQNGNQGNHGGNNGGEDLTHMRYYGMDTNHDGQISRSEWRGNDNSFNQADWNGDGVLSGIEVTPGAQRPVDFNSLDRNHDNRISPSEWRGDRAFFNLLDTDRNGFLSQAEFGQYGGLLATNRLQDLFRALDANHDNRIGQAEWPAAFPVAIFNALDTNHDNFLTLEEIRRIANVLGNGDDDGDDDDDLQATFNSWDTNHDNQISRSEWHGGSRLFNRLDTNHDGFLSWTEFSTRGHH